MKLVDGLASKKSYFVVGSKWCNFSCLLPIICARCLQFPIRVGGESCQPPSDSGLSFISVRMKTTGRLAVFSLLLCPHYLLQMKIGYLVSPAIALYQSHISSYFWDGIFYIPINHEQDPPEVKSHQLIHLLNLRLQNT